jgi:hypothetical protein
MAKANLILLNGTKVEIEGTTEEVHKLLSLYSGESPIEKTEIKPPLKKKSKLGKKAANKKKGGVGDEIDTITEIVNKTKECQEAENIEENILDRTSQIDRALLPLYIVHEYFDNALALQSGEIATITAQLGIPVAQPNASRTLSGPASRYVMGDKTRKARQAVKYKLNRRGVKYLKAVINGESDE